MPPRRRPRPTDALRTEARHLDAPLGIRDRQPLGEAHGGILFHPPENVIREFPQFPVTQSYAELRELFDGFWTTLLVAIVGPAVTMRLLAEERSNDTLELLLTMPVTDWQVVLGQMCPTPDKSLSLRVPFY